MYVWGGVGIMRSRHNIYAMRHEIRMCTAIHMLFFETHQ